MKEMKSKYRGYCNKCHYTVWRGEKMKYNGNVFHLDCIKALRDPTPRVLDGRYLNILGAVDKGRLLKRLERLEA